MSDKGKAQKVGGLDSDTGVYGFNFNKTSHIVGCYGSQITFIEGLFSRNGLGATIFFFGGFLEMEK